MSVPNGSADAPIEVSSTIPSVVGINFGNSYASIAVFTKEGLAECIANEDGERQIACALAFFGEEMYIGNQAKHQLVKNSKNTIVGFRNLLGRKFSEIKQQPESAPVIQHPDIADEPAYKVQVLQPAPSPLPVSSPAPSHAPTPRSEPTLQDRILTVSEVTTIFLASLRQSAEDFLGKKVQGAVITVPSSFTDVQKAALEKAAADAGIKVYQLLEESGAASVTTTSDVWGSSLPPDRTQLVVDVGASSLSLYLLSVRDGLVYSLVSSSTPGIGGDQIDDKLIKFFATEFTKKTKTPLTVCPATDPSDKRAEAKLRLALEHTKRTLSASTGAATCSVESLKDGLDFTSSINRMRFDLLARPVYSAVTTAVQSLLAEAGLDAVQVDEIVYVGGTACLPGLDEHLCISGKFNENITTPFSVGTVVGGGIGDPTTILARGCAVQAALIESIAGDAELQKAFVKGASVGATARTIALRFPDDTEDGTWIVGLLKETPLPARRVVQFDIALTEQSKKFAFEIWEVTEGIRVETAQGEPDSEDEDEEPEVIETKHKTISRESLLAAAEAEALLGIKSKGSDKGKWTTTVEAQFIVGTDGHLDFSLKEIGTNGASIALTV
ncbi:Hsp70 protein-domain-containing protein [Mycena floridula]|nr:Hsp70 protein-domain-containing protein [Mycena floridula]